MNVLKAIPFFFPMFFVIACDGTQLVDNLKNTDGKFWIKMGLTILLLFILQYAMKKFRR